MPIWPITPLDAEASLAESALRIVHAGRADQIGVCRSIEVELSADAARDMESLQARLDSEFSRSATYLRLAPDIECCLLNRSGLLFHFLPNVSLGKLADVIVAPPLNIPAQSAFHSRTKQSEFSVRPVTETLS